MWTDDDRVLRVGNCQFLQEDYELREIMNVLTPLRKPDVGDITSMKADWPPLRLERAAEDVRHPLLGVHSAEAGARENERSKPLAYSAYRLLGEPLETRRTDVEPRTPRHADPIAQFGRILRHHISLLSSPCADPVQYAISEPFEVVLPNHLLLPGMGLEHSTLVGEEHDG